jgi:hypothetical protein
LGPQPVEFKLHARDGGWREDLAQDDDLLAVKVELTASWKNSFESISSSATIDVSWNRIFWAAAEIDLHETSSQVQ